MVTKVCKKCDKDKLLSEFGTHCRLKSGISNVCFDCRRIETKIFYEKNKEKELERNRKKSKNFRLNNHEKALKALYEWKNKNKDYINEYAKKYNTYQYNNDEIFKLKTIIRNRIKKFLTLKNIDKKNKTFDIVGCSPEHLKEYLECKFTEGMYWEKMGQYIHIDHIIPLSSAKTEEEVYKLCHYTNLQPLWAKDNLRKHNKIV